MSNRAELNVDNGNGSSKVSKILVGMGSCGLATGAAHVYEALGCELSRQGISARLVRTGCFGVCSREVLVDIIYPGRTRVTYGEVTPDHISRLVTQHVGQGRLLEGLAMYQHPGDGTGAQPYPDLPYLHDLPIYAKQKRLVLRRCGTIDPEDIAEYSAFNGYRALQKVLAQMTPEQVIETVTTSKLRGRGGAGFPTGVKWRFCRQAKGEHKYLICNADEGDPGAFMDRSVLEGDPHAVLEGMLIGAYAIGADMGYIYVRAEYPLAIKRLKIALAQAKERGFLGENILGSGFSFDIRIKEGAGAFVCGEETALIASIEGERGMPRPRPPYPVVSGLWGNPTTINNVETLANISLIINRGAEWYAGLGTEKSGGTKIFALTGKIKNPGLVEVPLGTPLRDVIYEIGGGAPKRMKFKAAQLGGPSGGCVTARHLDLPIDYETLQSVGSIMGSGGMVVIDERSCMVDIARFFMEFTQSESCGKCAPCRIGTKRMLEALTRITEGEGEEHDLELLEELGQEIKRTSLCGLGQTAPNPALSTLRYFREEYEAHIRDKTCSARVCKALYKFYVDPQLCTKCGICYKKSCKFDAIKWEIKTVAEIDLQKCTKCGVCIQECPFLAIF